MTPTALRERFEAAAAKHETGLEKIRAIGEAYVQFAREEPIYFDLLARFEARTADPETATEHEQACAAEADRIMDAMTGAIQHGIDDGSIRPDLNPSHTAITLWGYTHGLIQLAIHKRTDLERQYGLDAETLVANGLDFAGVGLTGHAPSTAPAPPPGLFPDEKSET